MTENTNTTATNEATAIEQTLRDWYIAINQQNFKTVENMLTDDFLIVEHTELQNKQELMERFAQYPKDCSLTADLQQFQTQIHGDIAWTTLLNQEIWTPPPSEGEPIDLEYIETIILIKREGRWLINRYHATSTKPLPNEEET